ncbi:ABC transporter substrate-binding protein [Neomoorella thermoacetica]|uniref:ABC transporter, substrate-binding protein, aliphatic sulfonate n=1 Tax=Moorella thermoacetica (strain ATCC 39073 / JCM 9320) TaxID=264732 RepID=Q2RH10_MOOTA|nr:ABC transporter substrate-binding protein [Moorella thermoacetica]AKX94806.1 putative aliphatic sulfonates-binding protein precursor [Moorella thermoacetica]AKX97437.1 putative aliphatic sulfonates-binding protein precursor [Moorella thermoacetica]OIQ54696.1 putative aliphatic sulfonates-binding protein precursor [Moorella thermoacetica]OIQ57144.1 putative aliphatic sulfonates-binding protein precursor [Moorella thermoacetica]QDA01264.1 Putative aliphatic sulfonates-binding protein precurso
MIKKAIGLTLIALLMVTSLAGCGNGKGATASRDGEPAAIKVGTNRALGTVVPYIARTRGIIAAKGLKVDIVDFQDGSTLMEAFASGQLDIAFTGVAPAAIWQGKGVPLKVVASANGGGHVLLTREDAGIKDLSELKGKKIAEPRTGTVSDTLLRSRILQDEAKLDPEKNVQLLPGMAPADMPAALTVSKEVDAVLTWEPFASRAEREFKGIRVLYDAAAEWKKQKSGAAYYPVNVVVARQSFIDRHPDELKKFLAAYKETVDFINNRPDEANALIARELNLDKEIVASARQRIDYTWQLDIPATLETLKWSQKLGYLQEIPSPGKLFDSSYLPRE